MKTKLNRWASIALVAATFFCTAACGGGGADSSSAKMLVDLHGLMPSANEKPTASNPTVTIASKYIAQAYREKTGTEIVWATDYAKPTDTLENMVSWYNTQVTTGNCPAIGFSFGTGMQYDDMYIDLTEYLERPNPYVEGNVKWKDCFEEWVWDDPDVLDASGRIVSIPLLLNPGSATAVYYNKTAFAENNLSVPSTWKEYMDVRHALLKDDSIDYPIVPYTGDSRTALSSWVVEFNIAPAFAAAMMETSDYDGSGRTTTAELLRAVKSGVFNPQTSQAAKEVYTLAYEYYKTILPKGWASANYTTSWNSGKIGMMDNGLWYLPIENSNSLRSFDFGVFVPPVVQSDTSAYAATLEKKTVADGFESNVLMAFNIMKPAVENNPELLEKAVDFLMYLSTTDAVTALCQEHGGSLPAVKGAKHATLFDNVSWFDNEFYMTGGSEWPLGFTLDQTAIIDSAFADYVTGTLTPSQFYQRVNEAQQKGADTMISRMGIDTSSWGL